MNKDALIEVQNKLIVFLEENIAVQNKLIELLERQSEVLDFDEAINRLQSNLRMLRAGKGISQKKLSLLVNIDNGYISKLESGKGQNPSLKIMLRFCRFFRCGLSELLRE